MQPLNQLQVFDPQQRLLENLGSRYGPDEYLTARQQAKETASAGSSDKNPIKLLLLRMLLAVAIVSCILN